MDYDPEIEAAWYVLKSFISKEDFVQSKIKDGEKIIYTVNPNCVVSMGKKKGHMLQPKRLSKYNLCQHYTRNPITYYKSDYYSVVTTGYGRTDEMAQKLSFSKELDITSAVRRDEKFGTILLGIDIDVHNGQTDVDKVKDLVCHFIGGDVYWERSTGGKGWHGYLKIKYEKKSQKDYDAAERMILLVSEMFWNLDKIREHKGYKSEIDQPAGLPYKLEIVTDNPYKEQWETLFHKDKCLLRFVPQKSKLWNQYLDFVEADYDIKKESVSFPWVLRQKLTDDEVSQSFWAFVSEIKNYRPKNYAKITYRRALKLPFFGADSSSSYLPKMDIIKQFHELPYYDLSKITSIHDAIKQEVSSLSPKDCWPGETDFQDNIDWQLPDEHIDTFFNKKKSNKTKNKLNYNQKIEGIRTISDTMERTRKFISAFILKIGRIPTVDETQDEYIRLNLNHNEGYTQRRISRFRSCIDFYARTFDPQKATVDFSDWSEQKQSIIDKTKPRLPEKLTYKQGKFIKGVKIQEVVYFYHIICSYYHHRGYGIAMSHNLANKYYQQEFKKKCSPHKFKGIMDLLEQSKLISKSQGYIVGVMGKTYVPRLS